MTQPKPETPTERRAVQVTDPRLSPELRQELTAELQEAIGTATVEVPRDRPHPAEGERTLNAGSLLSATGARLLIVIVVAMFVAVGLVAVLSHSGLWLLPIPVVVLIGLALMIVRTVLTMTRASAHPSPVAAAEMNAEGIPNPDEYLSAIVDEFAPVVDNSEDRDAPAYEQPGAAAAEQRDAMTQTSGRSRAVGP